MKEFYPKRNRRIIITGGHLTPALAVIRKLQEEGDWQILFIGRKRTMEGDKAPSIESQIIPKLRVSFVGIDAGRIQRGLTCYYFIALFKIPLGFLQSFYQVKKFHPNIILSFGGYLGVPVSLAGWLLGIPIITHEQSVIPGLATRFITPLAKKIAVSWEETLKYFPQRKVVYTGNPIREEILKSSIISHRPSTIKTIYITGGNQGSHVINEAVRRCLPSLLKKYRVFHQCGTVKSYRDYEKLSNSRYQLPKRLRGYYRLKKWFDSQEVAMILKRADLVVSRAGANIISELAFLGKPALFIPLPLGSEQLANAKKLVETGLAAILPQETLTPKSLVQAIESLSQNLKKYRKRGKEAKKLIRTDASEKLIGEVKQCLKAVRRNIFS